MPQWKKVIRMASRGHRGRAFTLRRVRVVQHGLGNAVEHQADTHARRKEHGKPRQIAEVRLAVIRPEPERAVARHRQQDAEDQVGANGGHVEPAEGLDQPALHGREERIGHVWKGAAEHDEHADQGHGRIKHWRVDTRLYRFAITHALSSRSDFPFYL